MDGRDTRTPHATRGKQHRTAGHRGQGVQENGVGRQPVTALHSLLSTATHMCRFFVANLQRRSPGAAAETCRSQNPHSSPPTFALKMWHFLHK